MRRHAYIVVDLAFGDSGKATITDSLCRTTGANLVVRFSGGPQRGGNVVVGGQRHCFHQFASGTLAGARSYLGRKMLIEPYELLREAGTLRNLIGEDPLKKLFIEESCVVITPYHWLMNQIKETARGNQRHGSCGHGVGEARSDELKFSTVLRAKDLMDRAESERKLHSIRANKLDEVPGEPGTYKVILDQRPDRISEFYKFFADQVQIVPDGSLGGLIDGPVVFEGNQGVLIDETHGFAPYNTWTDCTFGNALALLEEIDNIEVTRLGVLRTYLTRHGAGPFPTESNELSFPDHNSHNEWQGGFRQGWFDAILTRYALRCVGGVDGIALTHCDNTANKITMPIVEAYRDIQEGDEFVGPGVTERLMTARPAGFRNINYTDLSEVLRTPILIESHGPRSDEKKYFIAKEKDQCSLTTK